jgi:surfactin synthase thioesterase subunit
MSAARALVRFGRGGPFVRRVVCVPSAGAAAAVFRAWTPFVDADTEVCAIERPGRGTRLAEAPNPSRARALAEIRAVLEHLRDLPCVLVGHSVGAFLAYEAARGLAADAGGSLRGVVACHARAPHALSHRDEKAWHQLDDAGLVDWLRRLGATPEAILDDPEWTDLFLPAIRADFALYDGYTWRPEPALTTPLVAVGAPDDPLVERTDLLAWREVAHGSFHALVLPGGHFAPQGDPAAFVAALQPLWNRRLFAAPVAAEAT